MTNDIELSLVIPTKSLDDWKLKRLLNSIEHQKFPQEKLEVLCITEGTSESAKAIGIKKSRGKVIGILASDNVLVDDDFLNRMYLLADYYGAAYPCYYAVNGSSLNRYFGLFGCNDPIPFYLGKNDKLPRYKSHSMKFNSTGTTLGDNGFFVLKKVIEKTDLEHYYHIDNANELGFSPQQVYGEIWHDTGDNLWTLLRKRYRYALQHGFDPNRRWHMITRNDLVRIVWFIIACVTFIHPLLVACYAYKKTGDKACLWHPVVCLSFLILYATLVIHLKVKSLSRWLSARLVGKKAYGQHSIV